MGAVYQYCHATTAAFLCASQVGNDIVTFKYNPVTKRREMSSETVWRSVFFNSSYTSAYPPEVEGMQVRGVGERLPA